MIPKNVNLRHEACELMNAFWNLDTGAMKHKAILLHPDCVTGACDARRAAFEYAMDAEEWARQQAADYKRMDYPFAVYVDGRQVEYGGLLDHKKFHAG